MVRDPVGESVAGRLLHIVDEAPIGPADLRMASLFTLDSLAATVGARTSPAAAPVRAWGQAEPMATARQAFVLGALSNVLEMDAMHLPSSVHPGTVVIPAATAIALRSAVTGPEFLRAVLRGSEAALRIGMAAGPEHSRRFQATSTCGGFGAAVAAAQLMRLDRTQQLHALVNAGTAAGGLWQFIADGAMSKQWHAGQAAQSGVVAAQLAATGFTGPHRLLEGEKGFFRTLCPGSNPENVLEPRSGWSLGQISYKPWPSPRPTHPAIDAALGAASDINGRAVDRVELETYPAAVDLCNQQAPATEHAARFSLSYCVAAALQDRRIDFASFDDASRARNAGLSARVTVAASERFAKAFPAACGAEVRVFMKDGAMIRSVREHARGDPAAPLSEAELIAKAVALLERGEVENPERIVDELLEMPHGGPLPVQELRRTLGECN